MEDFPPFKWSPRPLSGEGSKRTRDLFTWLDGRDVQNYDSSFNNAKKSDERHLLSTGWRNRDDDFFWEAPKWERRYILQMVFTKKKRKKSVIKHTLTDTDGGGRWNTPQTIHEKYEHLMKKNWILKVKIATCMATSRFLSFPSLSTSWSHTFASPRVIYVIKITASEVY